MNKAYGLIWSPSRRQWVVVSEISRRAGKSGSPNRTSASRRLPTFANTCIAVLLALTLGGAPSHSLAQVAWEGTNLGDWFATGNWSNAAIPDSSSAVNINNGTSPRISAGAAAADQLFIGSTTANNGLEITGGTLTTQGATLGAGTGGAGSLTVSGAGAHWINTGTVWLGFLGAGRGELNILNGGQVTANFINVGGGNSTYGELNIVGAGSLLRITEDMLVGAAGPAKLSISDGGALESPILSISLGAGGAGSVEVEGAGSSIEVTGALNVGEGDTGHLHVTGGGRVSADSASAGTWEGGDGRITIDGQNSLLEVSEQLVIGVRGDGALEITNQGRVIANGGMQIGDRAFGEAAISGEDSLLSTNGNLLIGNQNGHGRLSILDKAQVTSDRGTVSGNNADNSVLIDGLGSAWNITNNLTIAVNQFGTLTLRNGGVLDVGGSITLASLENALLGTGTGTLNIGAGSGSSAAAAGTLNASALTFGPGNATLVFNHTSNAYQFAPTLSGDGAVELYAGTTSLTGTNTYSGTTTVHGGTLRVNNTSGTGSSSLTVKSSGTLSGSGQISGATTIENGGRIAAGNSPGTLTFGDLTLNDSSILEFELGAPGGVAGTDSDLIVVTGDLVLDGILNITDLGGFDFAVDSGDSASYQLFNYAGSLTDNGLAFGSGVLAGYNYSVNTATDGEISLGADYTGLQFWDGSNTTPDGTVDGGNGTWSAAGTNWTSQDGNANTSWGDLTAVFSGSAGTVEVDGAHVIQGLQFATDGYVLQNADLDGELQLANDDVEIRVNDGVTATLDVVLSGAASLSKSGDGTAVLAENNTYTGGTNINAGTLSIGNGGTRGSVIGDISNNGALIFNRSDDVSYSGVVSGSGTLEQRGSGTLTLTNDHTYTGGTTISAGTLQIGSGGTSGSISGNILNDGALVFNRSDAVVFGDVISGTGTLDKQGSGALTLTGDNSFTGTTTIHSGMLTLGNGGSSGNVGGDIVNNGTLQFNRSDAISFAGAVTGSGNTQLLDGTTQFTGDLSAYTGTLSTDGGTLSIADGDTLMLGGNYTLSSSGTLMIGASSASSYGRLEVSGTATLADDANLTIDVRDINSLGINQTLSSVIQAGTLSSNGSFNIADNSVLFDFVGVLNGNDLDLDIVNGIAVEDAVANTTLRATLGAARTFDDLIESGVSGEMLAAITALGQLGTNQEVAEAVESTLPALSGRVAQLTQHSTDMVSNSISARQQQLAGLSSGDELVPDRHFWVKPFKSWAEQDPHKGVSGYDFDTSGLALGMDGQPSATQTLGMVFAYSNSKARSELAAGSNRVRLQNYQLGVYADRQLDDISAFKVHALLGRANYDSSRRLFTGDAATARYSGWNLQLNAELNRRHSLGEQSQLAAALFARYNATRVGAYSERGAGALNLNVEDGDAKSFIVGGSLELDYQLSRKLRFSAHAGIGYDLVNERSRLDAAYSGGGSAFSTVAGRNSPWVYTSGINLRMALSKNSEIAASYRLDGRNGFTYEAIGASVNWRF